MTQEEHNLLVANNKMLQDIITYIAYQQANKDNEDLKENDLPTYSTNPHCNTHFDINIYNKYKELFEKGMGLPNGVEMNCLMGNLLIKEGAENSYYKDTCITRFKDKKDLLNQIGDTECVSLRDSSIKCGMDKYLKELFPKPSKWEKTLKL